jgi:hypothetical protein
VIYHGNPGWHVFQDKIDDLLMVPGMANAATANSIRRLHEGPEWDKSCRVAKGKPIARTS